MSPSLSLIFWQKNLEIDKSNRIESKLIESFPVRRRKKNIEICEIDKNRKKVDEYREEHICVCEKEKMWKKWTIFRTHIFWCWRGREKKRIRRRRTYTHTRAHTWRNCKGIVWISWSVSRGRTCTNVGVCVCLYACIRRVKHLGVACDCVRTKCRYGCVLAMIVYV